MRPTYRAILLQPMICLLSASMNAGEFNNWQLEKLAISSQPFDTQAQITELEMVGYNVYILYRHEKIHLISALFDATLTHLQWIMAFSEHWGMSVANRNYASNQPKFPPRH